MGNSDFVHCFIASGYKNFSTAMIDMHVCPIAHCAAYRIDTLWKILTKIWKIQAKKIFSYFLHDEMFFGVCILSK